MYLSAYIIQHSVPSTVSTYFIDAPRYISGFSSLSNFNLNAALITSIVFIGVANIANTSSHNIIPFRGILCHLVLLTVGYIHWGTLLWKGNQCPSVLLISWIRMLRLVTLIHIIPFFLKHQCDLFFSKFWSRKCPNIFSAKCC